MTDDDATERAERDATEMKLFTRELFRETDETADAGEDDPSDTRPANQVPREGSNQEPPPGDDLQEFARQLFNPA